MPAAGSTVRALIRRLPVDPDLDGSARRLSRVRATALIAAGGLVGALGRAAIATAVPVAHRGWPTATLTVNLVGSLFLGVLLTALHERYAAASWARPLLGTGFCGGFTTFSTFAVDFTARAGDGRVALAVGYVAVSVVGALFAALVGVWMARSVLRLADRSAWERRLEHEARLSDGDCA